MDTITVKDGTQIYYKDWGTGQPLFFHHGWPLSADDWDAQMMFFLGAVTGSSLMIAVVTVVPLRR
jgi:pimeloyl-ACP methyl ester carboxylesterase